MIDVEGLIFICISALHETVEWVLDNRQLYSTIHVFSIARRVENFMENVLCRTCAKLLSWEQRIRLQS